MHTIILRILARSDGDCRLLTGPTNN
jgi:hypothetical protein